LIAVGVLMTGLVVGTPTVVQNKNDHAAVSTIVADSATTSDAASDVYHDI